MFLLYFILNYLLIVYIIIYIISLNLEVIILPNKVFKNFEIIKGSNSDFKKFSKNYHLYNAFFRSKSDLINLELRRLYRGVQ